MRKTEQTRSTRYIHGAVAMDEVGGLVLYAGKNVLYSLAQILIHTQGSGRSIDMVGNSEVSTL